MATYQRGKYWWYRFRFAGERIDEPTKSTSRTVAKEAERQHRRALEAGYNNFKEVRQNRVRILEEIIDEYLTGYRLRYRSASFGESADAVWREFDHEREKVQPRPPAVEPEFEEEPDPVLDLPVVSAAEPAPSLYGHRGGGYRA